MLFGIQLPWYPNYFQVIRTWSWQYSYSSSRCKYTFFLRMIFLYIFLFQMPSSNTHQKFSLWLFSIKPGTNVIYILISRNSKNLLTIFLLHLSLFSYQLRNSLIFLFNQLLQKNILSLKNRNSSIWFFLLRLVNCNGSKYIFFLELFLLASLGIFFICFIKRISKV